MALLCWPHSGCPSLTTSCGRAASQSAASAAPAIASLSVLLGRDPEYVNRFSRALLATSEEVPESVAAGSDFSRASLSVDVGRGNASPLAS